MERLLLHGLQREEPRRPARGPWDRLPVLPVQRVPSAAGPRPRARVVLLAPRLVLPRARPRAPAADGVLGGDGGARPRHAVHDRGEPDARIHQRGAAGEHVPPGRARQRGGRHASPPLHLDHGVLLPALVRQRAGLLTRRAQAHGERRRGRRARVARQLAHPRHAALHRVVLSVVRAGQAARVRGRLAGGRRQAPRDPAAALRHVGPLRRGPAAREPARVLLGSPAGAPRSLGCLRADHGGELPLGVVHREQPPEGAVPGRGGRLPRGPRPRWPSCRPRSRCPRTR